ncbi:TniQ family protein [Streptomyces sp. Ag109_G2-15]|uniref:TniQ family protein n=1 Tax=Streptomyces sp. Ag109_G2-15 TaxID=1938850 RepID=UPI000BD369BA|nr:TniQ family protein [Streptomyces sp. Ag109_G2-15]SOD91530.1 TniQ protein [Streptomyces sp. Ag109_G2-15]
MDGEAVPKPVGLEPVPGEAAASFVRRLAHLNGLSVGEVLREAGARRPPREVDPWAQEVFLGEQAAARLAVMAWRTPQELCRALPTLAAGATGRVRQQSVRVEPWPGQWTPLEPCAGCLARHDDLVTPVVLAGGEPWQVCVRHGRWLRSSDGGGPAQVPLAGLEEVVRAHRRRLRLQQQVGPYARALLADALQVAAAWWQGRQMGSETLWAGREAVLGTGRQRWAVPLVVYPEAVVVAEAMAVYERQRRWGREFDNGAPGWVSRRWIAFVGERLGMPGPMEHGGYRMLRQWTLRHRITAPVVARLAQLAPPPGYRAGHLPVMDPHHGLPERGAWEDASCLDWRLGRPVTALE